MVAYDAASRTATLTPSAPLSAGSYSATVQGVQDLAANTLASPRTWTFRVGAPAAPGRGPGTEPYDRPAGSVRGTSIAAHKLRIGPKRARVSRRGVVRLRVSCPAGSPCRIALRLRVGRRDAATRTTTISGGRARSVRLRLSRRTFGSLVRNGSLRATVIARGTTTTSARIRLIAPQARRAS